MVSSSLSSSDIAKGDLPGLQVELGREHPLELNCGIEFGPFTIAYQTYGTLNSDQSNAVLICHALTGDQFAADQHPVTGRAGWWDIMIGPGKVIDTTGAGDSFFAGLLAGMIRGLDIESAGRLGAAAAGCCVTSVGGSTGGRDYEFTARLAGIA